MQGHHGLGIQFQKCKGSEVSYLPSSFLSPWPSRPSIVAPNCIPRFLNLIPWEVYTKKRRQTSSRDENLQIVRRLVIALPEGDWFELEHILIHNSKNIVFVLSESCYKAE